jgi:hypothetical protein
MPPEGPLKTVKAFIGNHPLGELTRQDGNNAVAKALKNAQANKGHDIQQLLATLKTVAKGYVRYKKQLGAPKGEKKSKSAPKSKPKPTRKRIHKGTNTNDRFKPTALKKESSK